MGFSIYHLKPAFQRLLRPLCRGLARVGVSANQVTLAAMLLSLAVGALIAWRPGARWPLLLLPATLLLRMALNAIDGMLAREHGMKSPLGGILNEFGDVVSDTALYLPFALLPGVSARLVVLVVFLALLTEMAGVVAVQIGAARRYDGPMGKSDRAVVFALLALVLGLGATPGLWLDVCWSATAVLLAWTVFQRCRGALAEIEAQAPGSDQRN